MPGPAHAGRTYVEHWAPGAGVANADQSITLGGFAADMLLCRICRDPGDTFTGSANSQASCQIQQAAGLHLYDVFRNVRTDSDLFLPDDDRPELGVLVPAGAKIKYTVRHQATDQIEWLFYWATP